MAGVWRDEWSPSTLDDVLTAFADYVLTASIDELTQIEPLPFQRTLTEAQTAEVFDALRARWGIAGFYWYPLDREETAKPPPHAMAFDAEPFGEEHVLELLRTALAGLDAVRVLQLCEPPEPDRELALEWLESVYEGSESIVTDASCSWVVYASHESSVTVAGEQILPALQEAWPEWGDWTSWSEYW